MQRIKKVDVGSLALFIGTANGFVGFVIGVVITIAATVAGTVTPNVSGLAVFFRSSLLTLIIWPAVLFVGGLVTGLIYGLVFDIVARWTGGIGVELEK